MTFDWAKDKGQDVKSSAEEDSPSPPLDRENSLSPLSRPPFTQWCEANLQESILSPISTRTSGFGSMIQENSTKDLENAFLFHGLMSDSNMPLDFPQNQTMNYFKSPAEILQTWQIFEDQYQQQPFWLRPTRVRYFLF